MTGAVPGVATTTASRPVKNEPLAPPRAVRLWPMPKEPPMVNTPERLRPSASMMKASVATNGGD